MAYSPITWGYKDPGDSAKLQQGVDNSIWTSEHRIWGLEVVTTGSCTVVVQPGRIEIGGKWLYTTTTGVLTGDNMTHWEGSTGWAEGSSTAFYVVAYNSAGNDFDCKFRMSGPAYSDTSSGTSTGPKIYDKTSSDSIWYRYIGFASNNSACNFRTSEIVKDTCYYPEEATALVRGSAVAFTEIDVGPVVSKLGHTMMVLGGLTAASKFFCIRNAKSNSDYTQYYQNPSSGNKRLFMGVIPIFTGTNFDRAIDYKTEENIGGMSLYAIGVRLWGR